MQREGVGQHLEMSKYIAFCKPSHRAAVRQIYFIHALTWAVDLMLCEWMSDLGRKVFPPAPLCGLWSCPNSLCYMWYTLQINRFLPQRSLSSGGSSYFWTYVNYPHLGKWIILQLILISQKFLVPSVTLLSPLLLLHILPVDSSHSWGSLQDPLGLLLISSQAPGQLLLAQCPSRGGGPINVTLFSWSGSCQTYVPSEVLALTWETGGTLLAFSKGVLLLCCVI